MSFELLDHPADIGFRAFGATPADLFANAAVAMLSISTDLAQVSPREQYELSAEGSDYESLMVNWLSEVLFWFDGRRVVMREFRVSSISPSGIRAVAAGEPRDPERHRAHLIIKAVTYHQIKVACEGDRWISEVYLDI